MKRPFGGGTTVLRGRNLTMVINHLLSEILQVNKCWNAWMIQWYLSNWRINFWVCWEFIRGGRKLRKTPIIMHILLIPLGSSKYFKHCYLLRNESPNLDLNGQKRSNLFLWPCIGNQKARVQAHSPSNLHVVWLQFNIATRKFNIASVGKISFPNGYVAGAMLNFPGVLYE